MAEAEPGGGPSLGAALLELPAELLRPYEFCLLFLRAVRTYNSHMLCIDRKFTAEH